MKSSQTFSWNLKQKFHPELMWSIPKSLPMHSKHRTKERGRWKGAAGAWAQQSVNGSSSVFTRLGSALALLLPQMSSRDGSKSIRAGTACPAKHMAAPLPLLLTMELQLWEHLALLTMKAQGGLCANLILLITTGNQRLRLSVWLQSLVVIVESF